MNLHHESNDRSGTRPIPLPRRRGLIFPAFAWSGFSSAFASVIVGSHLQASLGTLDALFAVTLGNWILFIYSAAISFAAGRWGLSSQLVLEGVFGRWGAVIPGALLGMLVTGWFAFHVTITANILAAVLHLHGDSILAICAIGILFALPVIVRISHGFNMTAIAIPTMTLFAAIVFAHQLVPKWAVLLDGPIGGTLPFGTGVCIAFGTFVVSGTMTGDIVRFCRTGNEAVQATAFGFLLTNLPFLILGVLVAASGIQVIDLFTAGNALSWLLLALVIVSNWTTCDACLTNAGVTFKGAFPTLPWLGVAGAATLLGIFLALIHSVDDVSRWTLLLAAIASPIGGVIIADYYVVRVRVGFSRSRVAPVNLAALAATGAGVLVAALCHRLTPGVITPLISAPAAGCLYLFLSGIASQRLGADLGAQSAGAEALD
ncbi:Purine-cytosine permease [Burkholderia sp. YR290]|jgi:cytosine permease|uniref:cytosine permease n=1 Tax=Paraburkholderia hospita TaxID=169430 RepID=UPI0009A82239|nr:cytosine permease [Paraburkholderia hospita]SKC99719.1 Purine-cytosine permease [Paraburkholderia hospita]SOE91168.1 Purine-cytosine permease [Burkholderia sp. YR290]